MANRQISPDRQAVFYLGRILQGVGFLLFISNFCILGTGLGNPHIDSGGFMFRAVGGMLLIMIGGVMSSVGKMGLAGSGLKLDPEEARRDVEPWSRMAGGVVKDAIDEANIKLESPSHGAENMPFDERLRRLQKLRDDGLINAQEYEATKKKILESA